MKKIWLCALFAAVSSLFMAGCDSSSAQSSETLSLLLQLDSNSTGAFMHPTTLTSIGGSAFFFASDPVFGSEPWISDGTPEGTRMLMDIMPGVGDSGPLAVFPDAFVEFDGLVYFVANDGLSGRALWRTDGTEAGTELFADILAEGLITTFLRVTGNRMYISTSGNGIQYELWVLEVTP